jgi:hypothetical protein
VKVGSGVVTEVHEAWRGIREDIDSKYADTVCPIQFWKLSLPACQLDTILRKPQ